ncbi:MAG: hypothetical protein B7Z55_09125, partial [Planctomycetales bacterium 12-60-4]
MSALRKSVVLSQAGADSRWRKDRADFYRRTRGQCRDRGPRGGDAAQNLGAEALCSRRGPRRDLAPNCAR